MNGQNGGHADRCVEGKVDNMRTPLGYADNQIREAESSTGLEGMQEGTNEAWQ
jgi:hypothetical protein